MKTPESTPTVSIRGASQTALDAPEAQAAPKLAWHFVGDKLRDGRQVPEDGEWLEYRGPLVLCESGLHWSREPFDALTYAPGPTLCLVEVGGEIVEGDDKGISTHRKIIARMDATELLRYFARMQALSVIHLNEGLCNSEVVCDYLMTGDESLRAAAWAAARDAARDAAWAAARAAARAAAIEKFNNQLEAMVIEARGNPDDQAILKQVPAPCQT